MGLVWLVFQGADVRTYETSIVILSTLLVNRLEEASKLLYLLLSLCIRLCTHTVDLGKD
jgi:hypothetical protein